MIDFSPFLQLALSAERKCGILIYHVMLNSTDFPRSCLSMSNCLCIGKDVMLEIWLTVSRIIRDVKLLGKHLPPITMMIWSRWESLHLWREWKHLKSILTWFSVPLHRGHQTTLVMLGSIKLQHILLDIPLTSLRLVGIVGLCSLTFFCYICWGRVKLNICFVSMGVGMH